MKFYVLAERTNLEGFKEQFTISVENSAIDNYESIQFFESRADAQKWIDSDAAKEWVDCSFEIVKDGE